MNRRVACLVLLGLVAVAAAWSWFVPDLQGVVRHVYQDRDLPGRPYILTVAKPDGAEVFIVIAPEAAYKFAPYAFSKLAIKAWGKSDYYRNKPALLVHKPTQIQAPLIEYFAEDFEVVPPK